MKPSKKTNAARILDALGCAYELYEVLVNEDDLSAISVASKLGAPPEQVFKTLVLRGDKSGVIMACIPAPTELALKQLASASGNKSIAMVPLKDVLSLTGYIRGGCSPVGTKKRYPVFIDTSAKKFERIYVNAGQRGIMFLIRPNDLALAVKAQFAEIISL